jgi:hypothetical protein
MELIVYIFNGKETSRKVNLDVEIFGIKRMIMLLP